MKVEPYYFWMVSGDCVLPIYMTSGRLRLKQGTLRDIFKRLL
jgi:hypothetical protein